MKSKQHERIYDLHSAGVITSKGVKRFVEMPAFHYSMNAVLRGDSVEDNDVLKHVWMSCSPVHFPFPEFTLFDKWYLMACMQHHDNEWLVVIDTDVVMKCDCGMQFDANPKGAYRLQIHECECGGEKCSGFSGTWWKLHFESKLHNLPGGHDGKPMEEQAIKTVAQLIMDAFKHFLIDAMHPANTIVKIGPAKKEGDNVKWRLAHTHYVILNQKQARLCQSKSRGPSDQQLIRAAHWRRAHFRRLSSGRFINKRGALVPVRHAWVGPKEWTGMDQKTYKVIDDFKGVAKGSEGKQNGTTNNH